MKTKCAESVYHSEGNWGRHAQCTRNAGHGPESKYCSQHAEQFAEGETVTWYRADCFSQYSCGITPVQVLKDTGDFLLVKEDQKASRQKKTSEWHRYFPTHGEAVEFYRKRIEGLRDQADQLEQKVDRLVSAQLDNDFKTSTVEQKGSIAALT